MDFLIDIGRVLLDFDFGPSLRRLFGAEIPAEEAERRLERLLSRKDDFEAGRVSLADYVPWALETLEISGRETDFLHAWRDIFVPNEPMWAAMRRLAREGHRLILFSNTNGIHCPWLFERWPEFSLFHGAVLSHEVGAIKPEPAIYRHAIERFALEPERTRYVDDLPANIEAGRAFGLRTHGYRLDDHPAFERWLEAERVRG